jgi:O-antigen/teichoic acid export membrane protein
MTDEVGTIRAAHLDVAEAAAPVPRAPARTFLRNVAWGWAAVAVNLVIGIVLAPLIIERLGVARYGLWVLLFSTLEYLRMLDFGFRAAVVNACARFRAREDWAGVSRTLATALTYFVIAGALCCAVPIISSDLALALFKVPLELRGEAQTLIAIIAVTVGLRLVLSPLTATLEAFQRFDLVNRAYISALVVRSAGSLVLLLAGYGLVEMALVILFAQAGESAWNLVSVRRIVPGIRFSVTLVQLETLRALFAYGRHSAVMAIANMFSLQAPATIIGFLLGPAAVGIFSLPQRLLLYSAEAFARVSDVTSSVTAELDETHNRERVWRLAVLTNRSCLTLFLPVAVFLWFYGPELLQLWVPRIAGSSAPLLAIMTTYFLFAVAGQYNAGAVLLGQAKHRPFAWGTVAEVVLTVSALFIVVPRFGLVGAAWVVTTSILLIRGIYLAVLICRVNGFSLGTYITAIYGRPLLIGLPVALSALWLKRVLPGGTWLELIVAGATITLVAYGLSFFFVIDPAHRAGLLARFGLAPRVKQANV